MCSKRRMMVATGSCEARAERRVESVLGTPTCLKPEGTVWRILIGYCPFGDRLWRVYNQAATVRTRRTKAFRRTAIKNSNRTVILLMNFEIHDNAWCAYLVEGTVWRVHHTKYGYRTKPQGRASPKRHQVVSLEGL